MDPRIVVVTGASSGIGRATAIAFGKRGCRVALLARGVDGLRAAAQEVEHVGGRAMFIPTDVSDAMQVEAAAAQVEAEWGAIDVWVNNAMATVYCDVHETAPSDFKRVTEVTYLGAVWGTLAALKRMRTRDRGVIVQIGSALAYRSIPLQAAYCGAKSALRGFTDSLRSELIHERSRVHVTVVHPSALNTPLFDVARNYLSRRVRPFGKIFQPELAAEAIVWATTHRRREVWVGLPAAQAIIANRIAPALLDRWLARRGYEGQQEPTPEPAQRPDNLYRPVPGDHGAHGRFDDRAVASSVHFWMSRHRSILLGAAGALLAGMAVTNRRR
jgi:short-subunit dehydrogenase